MSTPAVTDWNSVAHTKLTRVLGETAGRRVMAEVLDHLGLDKLRSVEDLRRFADELRPLGGFTAAVAGLLSLHATLYGSPSASGGSSRPP